MRIAAFDQSSNLSGFCLYDEKILDSGVIDKHKITNGDVRVLEMASEICKKIDELNPSLVVIEDIQNQSSIKTVIMLARLQGAILSYCHTHKIDVEILSPSKWRSKLNFQIGKGVKREELKEQAMYYIVKNFGFEVDEDQSEAICIAVAADKMFDDDI